MAREHQKSQHAKLLLGIICMGWAKVNIPFCKKYICHKNFNVHFAFLFTKIKNYTRKLQQIFKLSYRFEKSNSNDTCFAERVGCFTNTLATGVYHFTACHQLCQWSGTCDVVYEHSFLLVKGDLRNTVRICQKFQNNHHQNDNNS